VPAITEMLLDSNREIHVPNTRPVAEATGFTTLEARRLLGSIGPNAIVDVAQPDPANG
jgi:hypothetical protein